MTWRPLVKKATESTPEIIVQMHAAQGRTRNQAPMLKATGHIYTKGHQINHN